MAYKFRLYLENGEEIGDFETGTLAWGIGDEFWNRDHDKFRVMNVIGDADLGGEDYCVAFVVVRLELAESVA